MNENEELLAGIQRAHDELDAIVSAWNRVTLKAMDAAADERAKIVDHIRKVADRVENDPNGNVWGHLLATAIVIEAGEHLK
jgi:hypothetical protein